jgi:signal transduction histidine kinase
MPSRRLDNRLRQLCSKVVHTPDNEVEPVLKELQAAIQAKFERIRVMATFQFQTGKLPPKQRLDD